MKNKIKGFFRNNLLSKVIGFVLAVLLWIVLTNSQDPLVQRQLTLTINYDESYLEENNYIAISKPSTVTIQVTTRRSNVSRLRADDFTAKVDMQEYLGGAINEAPESTKVNLVISKAPSATFIEDWSYLRTQGAYVEVVIDRIKSQDYTIQLDQTGELPEGYTVGEMNAEPKRVRVTGATTDFSNLASVRASVDVSQLNGDDNFVIAELHLYDGNNRQLTNRSLKLSESTVTVTVGLLDSKEVGINVRYSGEPENGYGISRFDYNPKIVEISGSKSTLASISTITIPRTAMDISGATENQTFRINLENYLSPDVSLAEGTSPMLDVTFEIEKLEEETFLINTDAFQFIGADERYNYELVSETAEITLRSFREELAAFKQSAGESSYLQGTINVMGMEPDNGTVFVPVMLTIDSRYSVVRDIKVEIRITRKNADDETDTIGKKQPDVTAKDTEDESFDE